MWRFVAEPRQMTREEGEAMSGLRRVREMAAGIVPFAFLAVLPLISGCATTSALLDMNALSSGDVQKAAAQESTFNAARFEILGGATYNIFCYVLYQDGFEVRTSGPLTNLGKMTFREAQSRYDRDRHTHYFSRQSRARISEVVREGSVIGYTFVDENVDVDLWEDAAQTDKSKVVLTLIYEDTRKAD